MLKFNVSNKVVPEIKRGILSAISSIFDPMGLIAPVIVKIKFLIKELQRRGLVYFYGQIQKLFWIIYKIQKPVSDHTLCDDATKFE